MADRDRVQVCDRCGSELLLGQLVCAECGAVRRQRRRVRCRACGTLNTRGRDVCLACGEPLRGGWVRPAILGLAAVVAVALLVMALPWLRSRWETFQLFGGATPEAAAASAVPILDVAPTVSPTASASPSPRPTETPTLTPLPSATSTPTATPTNTPAPSATPRPTSTPLPTFTATVAATISPAPTATASPSPTTTASPTATASPSPVPSATLTPTPMPSPTPLVYEVKSGDTLYDIALQFDTTVEAIMAANDLENTQLRVGQKLFIPRPTPSPTPTP